MGKKVRDKECASLLGTLAGDKLSEVLTKGEENHKRFVGELKSQLSGYRFSCKRHGDFLTLFVTQKNNKSDAWEVPTTKYSTTINLSQIRTLKMEEGSGVTRDYIVRFDWKIAEADDSIHSGWGYSSILRNPGENESYFVNPKYPQLPAGRPLFVEPSKSEGNSGGFHGSIAEHIINFRIPNQPFPSISDKIYFDGSGCLVVPHGKGDEVYKTILEELGTWDGPLTTMENR